MTKMSVKYFLPLILLMVFIVLTNSGLCQATQSDEALESELDRFYQHRSNNLKEAKNIIDALYNNNPSNLKIIKAKIEFEIRYQGRFEAAHDLYLLNKNALDSSDYVTGLNYYFNDVIPRYFSPLILTVKDRKIIESAYIPNIDIIIQFPDLDQLKPIQQSRLKYIRSAEFSTAKRFHFIADSSGGENRVIEIDYFPVSASEITQNLVIDKIRRYPFVFSESRKDTLSIYWHDDWVLREWIPDDVFMLTYQSGYSVQLAQHDIRTREVAPGLLISEIPLVEDQLELRVEPQGLKNTAIRVMRTATITMFLAIVVASIIITTGG